MAYKTASQKILVWLFIIFFTITIISGSGYWKMWSILPVTFFMLWLADVMFMDDKSYVYEPNNQRG